VQVNEGSEAESVTDRLTAWKNRRLSGKPGDRDSTADEAVIVTSSTRGSVSSVTVNEGVNKPATTSSGGLITLSTESRYSSSTSSNVTSRDSYDNALKSGDPVAVEKPVGTAAGKISGNGWTNGVQGNGAAGDIKSFSSTSETRDHNQGDKNNGTRRLSVELADLPHFPKDDIVLDHAHARHHSGSTTVHLDLGSSGSVTSSDDSSFVTSGGGHQAVVLSESPSVRR